MLLPGYQVEARQVEILISLSTIDPPVGHLRVTSGADPAPGHGQDRECRFTGWLGLLRALYEVTGSPSNGPPGDR